MPASPLQALICLRHVRSVSTTHDLNIVQLLLFKHFMDVEKCLIILPKYQTILTDRLLKSPSGFYDTKGKIKMLFATKDTYSNKSLQV